MRLQSLADQHGREEVARAFRAWAEANAGRVAGFPVSEFVKAGFREFSFGDGTSRRLVADVFFAWLAYKGCIFTSDAVKARVAREVVSGDDDIPELMEAAKACLRGGETGTWAGQVLATDFGAALAARRARWDRRTEAGTGE